jgi:hypothetical protein
MTGATDLAPRAAADVARLARVLIVEAAAVLPGLEGEARAEALAAIDDFAECPLPSRWLGATRTLRTLGRRARGEHNLRLLAARSFARGLERVAALSLLDETTRAALATLPLDAGAGRRLEALAYLVAAHQELAGRVRDADATQRTLKAEIATESASPPSKPSERRRRR